MAKIGKMDITLNGVDYSIAINCNSSGEFSINPPAVICSAIGVDRKIISKSLDDVKKIFYDALNGYKKALCKTDVKSSAVKKSKKFDVTVHLFGKSFKGKM